MQQKFEHTPKLLRRILQLDRPVKVLSTAEADQAREDNFRWNIAFNSLDVIFFMGGASLLSTSIQAAMLLRRVLESNDRHQPTAGGFRIRTIQLSGVLAAD